MQRLSPAEVQARGLPERPAEPPFDPPYEDGLWLAPIHPGLRAQARARLDAGDVDGFLISACSNVLHLELVYWNDDALHARECYETALLRAFGSTRTNNARYRRVLPELFAQADRTRLRAAGQPLPGPGPFTIYRGVGGRGRARWVRGYSWTGSRDVAVWFMNRAQFFGLHDPAVYQVTIAEPHVLAYLHGTGRNEDEYLVDVAPSAKPVRMPDVPSPKPDAA